MLQERLTGDLAMLGDDGRHQRRQHQHMRNVVAVIGHQHRLLARQNDDIADGVLLDLKLVHLQRVLKQLAGAGGRHRGVFRVRHVAQQVQVAVELLGQLLAGKRTLARAKQGGTTQVHGVGRTGVVNAHHQIGGNGVNRWRQPGRTHCFDRVDGLTPLRHTVIQVGHQRHRFAEVHIPLAEVTQLAQAPQHLQQALFLFGSAA